MKRNTRMWCVAGTAIAALACVVALSPTRAGAQEPDSSGTSRLQGESRPEADARLRALTPDPVTYPVPRTKWDGKPDFSGVYWERAYMPDEAARLKSEHLLHSLSRPETWQARARINRYDVSGMHCWPETPIHGAMHPFQEIQLMSAPGYFAIINENYRIVPIVPPGGRAPAPSAKRGFMGDSVGHWEGDTLVIEIANFRTRDKINRWEETWSDALRVVERWSMPDARFFEYEFSAADPKILSGPWSAPVMRGGRRMTYDAALESICVQDTVMERVNTQQLTAPEEGLRLRNHAWDKWIPR